MSFARSLFRPELELTLKLAGDGAVYDGGRQTQLDSSQRRLFFGLN